MGKLNRVLFSLIFVAVLFMTMGCNMGRDNDYNTAKQDCIRFTVDNLSIIEDVVLALDEYDFGVDIYCNDGVVEVYGQADGEQKKSILSDEKLLRDCLKIFENGNVYCISKTAFKNKEEYVYSIHFNIPKKGYQCQVVRICDKTNISTDHEYIAANWYYFEGLNE